jgi:tRNA threonylcarbamoyladenosine biosynthesis protein TsaB
MPPAVYTRAGTGVHELKDAMTATDDARAILALDTSTEQAGVALLHGRQLFSLAWHAGRSHTVTLLDQVHRLLGLAAIGPGDLTGIAVATGPGAFTGLRVGISAAKGFHLALGLPLVGVSTLEAAALPAAGPHHLTVATVAAGRGRIAWAAFAMDEAGGLVEAAPARNSTVTELAATLASFTQPVVVTGELPADGADELRVTGVRLLAPELRMRRPEAIIAIASSRFDRGDADDAVALEPVYLGR